MVTFLPHFDLVDTLLRLESVYWTLILFACMQPCSLICLKSDQKRRQTPFSGQPSYIIFYEVRRETKLHKYDMRGSIIAHTRIPTRYRREKEQEKEQNIREERRPCIEGF